MYLLIAFLIFKSTPQYTHILYISKLIQELCTHKPSCQQLIVVTNDINYVHSPKKSICSSHRWWFEYKNHTLFLAYRTSNCLTSLSSTTYLGFCFSTLFGVVKVKYDQSVFHFVSQRWHDHSQRFPWRWICKYARWIFPSGKILLTQFCQWNNSPFWIV